VEIYIITLVILFFFALIEIRVNLKENQKKIMRIILFVIMVIQVGLRWETGTDWPPYLSNFNATAELTDALVSITIGFEPGYAFFVLFVRKITDSYSVFLFLHALIYYFFIFKAFKILTPYYFVTFMFFYATNLGVMGSNRQLIALAICLFALKYIITEKNAIKFFSLVLLAFLFHTTALIFTVFYFFNKDIKKFWIITILFISFIIGKSSLPFSIFSMLGNLLGGVSANKADFYTEGAKEFLEQNPLGFFGLLKRVLFLIFFSINYNFLSEKLPYYKYLFNGYYFGLIFYFLFSSTLLILVNRGSLYFNVMECFLIASQLLVFKTRIDRSYFLLILFFFCIALLFQSISGYADLFVPYKGLFINSDYYREMR
jgi:hypothetical protein